MAGISIDAILQSLAGRPLGPPSPLTGGGTAASAFPQPISYSGQELPGLGFADTGFAGTMPPGALNFTPPAPAAPPPVYGPPTPSPMLGPPAPSFAPTSAVAGMGQNLAGLAGTAARGAGAAPVVTGLGKSLVRQLPNRMLAGVAAKQGVGAGGELAASSVLKPLGIGVGLGAIGAQGLQMAVPNENAFGSINGFQGQDAAQGALLGAGAAGGLFSAGALAGPPGILAAAGIVGVAALGSMLLGREQKFDEKKGMKKLDKMMDNVGLDDLGQQAVRAQVSAAMPGANEKTQKTIYNSAVQLAQQERMNQIQRDAQQMAFKGQQQTIQQFMQPATNQIKWDAQVNHDRFVDTIIPKMQAAQQPFARQAAEAMLGGAQRQAGSYDLAAQLYPLMFQQQNAVKQAQSGGGQDAASQQLMAALSGGQ